MNRNDIALQILIARLQANTAPHPHDAALIPAFFDVHIPAFFHIADEFLRHAGEVYHRPEAVTDAERKAVSQHVRESADDVADIFAKYRENIDILHGELRDKDLTIATLQKSMDTLAAQLLRADEKAECLERTVAELRKRIQEVTLERDIAWANARRQAPQPPTNPFPSEDKL
jgi:hypothetical protein